MMTRYIFIILAIGISASSIAEPVSFQIINIDVPTEWAYSSIQDSELFNEPVESVSIYHPDGIGVLKIKSYITPAIVNKDRLRLITNVDLSTELSWQQWGNFSGYHFSYIDRGSLFTHWTLLNERTILMILYESNSDELQGELNTIVRMIESIRRNPP